MGIDVLAAEICFGDEWGDVRVCWPLSRALAPFSGIFIRTRKYDQIGLEQLGMSHKPNCFIIWDI
jgi:hypothetical protein